MATYALIRSGTVWELSTPANGAAITSIFSASMPWIVIVGATPEVGYVATETNGTWTFASPAAPPGPTLAQQALMAIGNGLTITSTGTPAINGLYDVSQTQQDHMQAEMIALLNSGSATFADGTASLVWPDMSGAPHTFTPTEAKAFFLACGAYVAALYKVINGTIGTLPAASATIA